MSKFKQKTKQRAAQQIKFRGFFSNIKQSLAQDALECSFGWASHSVLAKSGDFSSISTNWIENNIRSYLEENFKPDPKGFLYTIFWSYILQAVIKMVVEWLLRQYTFDKTFFINLSNEN